MPSASGVTVGVAAPTSTVTCVVPVFATQTLPDPSTATPRAPLYERTYVVLFAVYDPPEKPVDDEIAVPPFVNALTPAVVEPALPTHAALAPSMAM
jgi:hypothetical protein